MMAQIQIEAPCGFQNTFFECEPDHMVVVRRVYGWTRRQALRRAQQRLRSGQRIKA